MTSTSVSLGRASRLKNPGKRPVEAYFSRNHREEEVHSFGCVMVADGCGEQRCRPGARPHFRVLGEFACPSYGLTITEVDGLATFISYSELQIGHS